MEANRDCPFCDKRASLKSTVVEKEFKKEVFTINEFYYKCDTCSEEFTTEKTDEITLNQIYNQYREKFGLPFPEELVRLREKYEISAQKMSQILGLGINTYSNYEKGEIPTSANAKLIASARRPDIFLTYLSQSKDVLSEQTCLKIEETVKKVAPPKEDDHFLCNFNWHYTPNRYTGYTIPNPEKATNLLLYFLSNCNPEFNDKLKLNKMLFYTDFFNYKATGRSISGISYRAIPYGPAPSNYDFIFAHFIEKEEIIEPVFIKINQTKVNECYKPLKDFDLSVFNPEELNSIKKVVGLFKDTPSWDLVELSHHERAWIELNKTKSIISYQDYAFDISINE
jgi:putative zinc finger/helix-turn-helix YgiT family protein